METHNFYRSHFVRAKADFSYTLAVASLELQNKMAAFQAFTGTVTFDGFALPWRFLEDIVLKGLIYT